jgi:hypothetical protein
VVAFAGSLHFEKSGLSIPKPNKDIFDLLLLAGNQIYSVLPQQLHVIAELSHVAKLTHVFVANYLLKLVLGYFALNHPLHDSSSYLHNLILSKYSFKQNKNRQLMAAF